MKKVCVMVMLLVFAFGTAGYGAVSDDVYVRKDVFEAYMHRVDDKLDMILGLIREQREEHKAQIAELKEEIKGVREEHKAQITELREEQKALRKDIEALSNRVSELTGRVEGLDARLGDLRNDIYLGLVILGIIVGLPAVQKIFQSIADRKPSLTVEDVIRLIEENNIKLSGKTQA
ncbi:MAG: HBL/NHE enterotoxin family protein [Synergistaceae bacterium]|nr:HBL/NHE enterotoxin family protein [Synergistaceae bacterium]